MVVLVSIDGCRPDALRHAATPNIDQMVKDGSVRWDARTVSPTISLPCHNSMVRSVPPSKHGITTDTFTPLARPVPSLFDVAAESGKTCGMFYNWPQLRDLAEPASVSASVMYANSHDQNGDATITDVAIASVKENELDFIFLSLGHTDWSGHEYGWMSDEYLEAINRADLCVGRMANALIELKKPIDIVLVSSHGGHDQSHGTNAPEDVTVPFLMWGYRCEKGFAIDRDVSIMDVAPTCAYLMEVPVHRSWEGVAVLEAIRDTPQSEMHHHTHHVYGLTEDDED